jgi:predicted acylesterase/phospholipase RssA
MRFPLKWSLVGALAANLLLSACATQLPVVAMSDLGSAGGGRLIASEASRVNDNLPIPRTTKRRAEAHEVLVLTSGGADGAFGAGALVSWTKSGRRPVFDVVSGVSTGALQAPLAFLGPDYDAMLEEVFTSSKTSDVLSSNGLSGLLGSGLYGSGPLREKLLKLFDDSILDLIADAHRNGRRLYVTTTDLTNGRTVIWDMGAIASSGEFDRRSRFIGILLASIAVPGLIDPVMISRPNSDKIEIHGDGGVKTPVPLQKTMMVSPVRHRHVTVIANGHVSDVAANIISARSTLPLARRAVSLLLRRMLSLSSESARLLASKEHASFSLISLPLNVPEAVDPFSFDPIEMRKLFEAGKDLNSAVWSR